MGAAKFAKIASQSTVSTKDLNAEIDRIGALNKRKNGISFEAIRRDLKETMWNNVGIVRKRANMGKALQDISGLDRRVDEMKAGNIPELQGCLETVEMLTVARLIATAAIARTESRGAHYREDFPQMKKEWEKNIVITKNNSAIQTRIVPTVKRT